VLEGDYLRRGIAEFVGAFALIFVGGGSGIYGPNIVAAAFANGLVIAVMVSAVGFISGGHFNPAVTLGFLVTRRITPRLAGFYWFAQFGGAALAALMLRWLLPRPTSVLAGVPGLAGALSSGKGAVIEAVLTFFLVWVIFATAVDARGAFKQIAGLAIGLTISLDVLMGGGLTGAAMNPARAFGPQLVADRWTNWWVWFVGPACGAVIAAVVYELLYLRPPRPVPVGPPETGIEEAAPGEAASA
jgi:aquaporin Z